MPKVYVLEFQVNGFFHKLNSIFVCLYFERVEQAKPFKNANANEMETLEPIKLKQMK